jgi:branched-chain amino acid transport system ATP-binding protein
MATSAAPPMILEVDDISKSFGRLRVADSISFAVAEGEALGIVGPNGAGKTTLFSLIAGALRPDRGRVRLLGRDITDVSPQARCAAGIARTHQIPRPFDRLTVFENVLVGACFATPRSEKAAAELCGAIPERTGLLAYANKLAGALPLLDRKRLELARALATRPRILLLDEIAGGLTESECAALIEMIRAIGASGVSILWIEHIVHALLAVVTRLVVLNFGQVVAEGEPRAVMASRAVREIYLGALE